MRHLAWFLLPAALLPVRAADADSQSFTVSTGYNETALTSGFNRGTVFKAELARGHKLLRTSLDSRGLASIGIGRIAAVDDIDAHTHRYPVVTVFARAGEGSGLAIDFHNDWYMRGAPTRAPGKHLTMFQTQGGIIFQDGQAPKVRVTHRLVTSQRRFPARTQGVEWVWEFREDYPTYYARGLDRGEMTPMIRRSMRAENWAFFSRELGFGILHVNVGATHKTVARDESAAGEAETLDRFGRASAGGTRRVPILMARPAYEVRRW